MNKKIPENVWLHIKESIEDIWQGTSHGEVIVNITGSRFLISKNEKRMFQKNDFKEEMTEKGRVTVIKRK